MRRRRVQFRTAVLLAVVALCAAVAPRALAVLGKPAPLPQLATVAQRSFPVVVAASGTVVPASQVPLDFAASGRVAEIDVSPGQHVNAGQVVARLDDSAQRAALAEAQAVLTGATSVLAAATQPVGSAQQQALKRAVSNAQATLDTVRSAVLVLNQQDSDRVTSDQNRLTDARAKQVGDGCGSGQPVTTPGPTPNPTTCQADQAAVDDATRVLQADQLRQLQDAQNDQSRIDQANQQLSDAHANLDAATAPDANRVAQAQASLDAARAQVDHAQATLTQTTLVAPVGGVVSSVNGQVGAITGNNTGSAAPVAPGSTAPLPLTGASGTSSAPSRAFLVLSTGTDFDVAAPFAEVDAARLAAGQSCTVAVDAVPGLALPCKVIGVASSATVISGVVSYYATVVPDSGDPRLKDGMTASVSVTVARADNVVAVPSQAVYSVGGDMLVDVWYEARAVATPVKIGHVGDTLTEITEGLADGQQVVIGSHVALRTPAP